MLKLSLCFLLLINQAFAQNAPQPSKQEIKPPADPRVAQAPSEHSSEGDEKEKTLKTLAPDPDEKWIFSNAMKRPNKRRSSVVWYPLLSYAVPGIGQFMNGQSGAGFVYSGVAVAGLGSAASAIIEYDNIYGTEDDQATPSSDLDSRDPIVRRFLWGMKTYDLAGSLSLYHAFQTNVHFRKQEGDFAFLPEQGETTDELMLAPFEFSNMGRWSTIIPLTIGLGLSIWSGATDNYNTRRLNSGDVLFSSAISYNAGVGEEALFRGWMFPLFVEAYGVENMFWANLTQAAIFGAAHFSEDNQFPVFQLAAGYYFGWLAKKNGWSLREAIFVHTWWDVIVFTASFTQGNEKASIYVPLYQTSF